MTPFMCQTKHDPENGSYGDCFRACIASLLDIEPSDENVPHFCSNGEPINGNARLTEFLAERGLVPFFHLIDGSTSKDEILEHCETLNPAVYYILMGANAEGDHCVVCRGDLVIHNPAWIPNPLIGPASNGFWAIMILARA